MTAPNGYAKTNVSLPEALEQTSTGICQYPKLERFSTFNTLSGGEVDFKELPLQIVSNIPFDYYCAYDIPAGTTRHEWFLSNANMRTVDPRYATMNSRSNTGIIGVCSVEDLAVLEATTIVVKGKPVQRRRQVAYKKSLVYVSLSGLNAVPLETQTRSIYNVLSPFGAVLDVEFERLAGTFATKAKALIDVNVPKIPRTVKIGGKKISLYSKRLD